MMVLNVCIEPFCVNHYGVKLVNQHLSPFIRENRRVFNVASGIGAWARFDMLNELQNNYKSPTLPEGQIDGLLEDFISTLEANGVEKLGYDDKPPYLQSIVYLKRH